jgi:hypothetical protein
MTFFYDLNKRLADLAAKQDLTESVQSEAKTKRLPGLPITQKDVEKKFGGSMIKMAQAAKEAGFSDARIAQAMGDLKQGKNPNDMDESAFQAAIGKKKYGAAGMKALQKAGRDQASDKTMDTIRNRYDKYDESMTDEGNEFSGELAQARAAGAKQFKVDGQSYPVKEGGTPMTPKQKSFAKLAPPANKITFADKIAGAKKEVDEMLGDVAAEAIKSAVGKKKEPRSKGTAFDPEVAKSMFANKDEHPRYDVKDTGYSKR